jgi:xanthine/uracil permease
MSIVCNAIVSRPVLPLVASPLSPRHVLRTRALLFASVVGTILQVAMVVVGHSNASVASLFAVGGMSISLIAGLLYARWARGDSASALAIGGLVAGALCALIGIFVSYMLGDVPMSLLALGTISSAVTGAIGGWIGAFLFRARGAAMGEPGKTP